MYGDGHWGISLLIFSPIAFLLTFFQMYWLLMFSVSAMLFLSRNPDIDMKLQRWTSSIRDFPLASYVVPQITHRGITHTVWYALLWAIIIGVIGAFLSVYSPIKPVANTASSQMIYIGIYGFFLGFLGIVAHLVGDVITPSGIRPWEPYRDTKYTLSLVYAKNQLANKGLFFVGAVLCSLATYSGFYFSM